MLAGVVGVVQQLRAKLEQPLAEERQLLLAHVFLVARLEKIWLGQHPDLFRYAFCCHVCTFPLPFASTPSARVRARPGMPIDPVPPDRLPSQDPLASPLPRPTSPH